VVASDEQAEVRVPGAAREEAAARADADGIALPADSVRHLRHAAERLGVALPWGPDHLDGA
jgi:LDH2 family malate/lactate/ureidoglycolate dehydrogenase